MAVWIASCHLAATASSSLRRGRQRVPETRRSPVVGPLKDDAAGGEPGKSPR